MKRIILNFLVRDDGPTAVEYAVMLAMIVVVCIVSVNLMARNTADSFDTSANQITTALGL